jgi:hypothetical protein
MMVNVKKNEINLMKNWNVNKNNRQDSMLNRMLKEFVNSKLHLQTLLFQLCQLPTPKILQEIIGSLLHLAIPMIWLNLKLE